MSVLESRISYFKNTKSTEVLRDRSKQNLRYWLTQIQEGTYKDEVEQLRAGDESMKVFLPTIAVHGVFKDFRNAKEFIEATGIIILDIDDLPPDDDIEEVKRDIFETSNNVVAVMTSPSGTGIKVLYYVDPYSVNQNSYRLIGKELVANYADYGHVDVLSITDALIVSYDPNILINEDAVPAFVFIKDIEHNVNVELEPFDDTKILWDNVEDFFDTVLSKDIAGKTNNNFHYIQVAIFDLAKFGFHHPSEDLSFVINYAELEFKRSGDNKKRFLEVVEIAKDIKHSRWAYKIGDDFWDDEEDGEIDYSDYNDKPAVQKKTRNKDSDEDELNFNESDDNDDGFIDYDNDASWLEVLEVVREGDRVGKEISLSAFADIFRFKGTGILTVTGIPSHGKTEFSDICILDLARLYNQSSIVVGYEQRPSEHIIKLSRKLIGKNVTCSSYQTKEGLETLKMAHDYLITKIKHLDTTKVGGNINTVLEKCARKIKEMRDNGEDPRYVVIDPFNMLSIKGRFSGHEKIEEILRRITQFSHQMDVLVILIAHPFKMKKDEKTGKYEVPDFYSVKGSSAFFEMSYHGLVVYRTGYLPTDSVLVKVLKVKQNNLGSAGEECFFSYEKNSGRYIPQDESGNEDKGDHRAIDWLEKAIVKNKQNINK